MVQKLSTPKPIGGENLPTVGIFFSFFCSQLIIGEKDERIVSSIFGCRCF